jgi:hypothetical protein
MLFAGRNHSLQDLVFHFILIHRSGFPLFETEHSAWQWSITLEGADNGPIDPRSSGHLYRRCRLSRSDSDFFWEFFSFLCSDSDSGSGGRIFGGKLELLQACDSSLLLLPLI